MIGSGVFTSLGFQVLEIHSLFALMMLWIVGGVVALCGALTYGALAAAMPRSGGEYFYLSKIFHPAIGFLSGWISLTVGFSAPVALSAMLLAGYASKVFPFINQLYFAGFVVIMFTIIHTLHIKIGSGIQNVITTVKVVLIIFIILSGFTVSSPVVFENHGLAVSITEIFSSSFAISLFWVSYSYSGWNASAYVAGEIDKPVKTVAASLLTGTLVVTLLYVFLNFVFLYTSPIGELAGQKEVGFVSARFIFGNYGGKLISAIIAVLLVSSVSSMIFAGPRVPQVMGEDYKLFGWFAKKNRWGIPYLAIIFQSVISLIMIMTATFESILLYIGFTLSIFTFLTVFGIFFLKRCLQTTPDNVLKGWGFPFVPLFFLIVTLWTIYQGLVMKPVESFTGLLTVMSGLIFYWASRKRQLRFNL